MKPSLLAAVGLAALPACYFSLSAPRQPYGQPALDVHKVVELGAATSVPPPIAANRPIILRRFDSRVVNPVGALHDVVVTNETPIWELYFSASPELPFFEAFAVGLRERGLRVFKDYDAHLSAADAAFAAEQPLVLSATLLTLRHDKVRLTPVEHYEVVAATLRIDLFDHQGRNLLSAEKAAQTRIREGSQDPIAAVAREVLSQTLATAEFRAALEGAQR